MLDDAADLAGGVAHDAAVAGGIVQHLGEHGGAIAARGQQAAQRVGLHQRHVAVQHQRHIVLAVALEQQRHGLLHGVAGALLRLLQREVQAFLAAKRLLDAVGAVADHHRDAGGREFARTGQHVRQHGLAGQRVQHFGKVGLHALAQSGGENHYIEHRGLLCWKTQRPRGAVARCD